MKPQASKFMPAVWGGLLIGIINGVPGLGLINCLCCAGTIGGGLLAVYLYRKDLDQSVAMQSGDGALLGLLAGVIGAVIGSALSSVFGVAAWDFLRNFSDYIDDPEIVDMLDRFHPGMLSGGLFFAQLMIALVINSIFGLIGGLLGVSLFGSAKTPPGNVPQA